MSLILGIETSCDETAAAVVEDGRIVHSDVVATQYEIHSPFGGVVPELAARSHVERIDTVIQDALTAAGTSVPELDAIAVTVGPGLAGALLVGVSAAKGLSVASGVPLVGVNHLEAHVYANVVDSPDFKPPAIILLVSGGHTMLLRMAEDLSFELLGQTLDDAVGEAFDKVGRLLGLGYPGGPMIDRLAGQGDPRAIKYPRPLWKDGYDFSFSGLKTAVVQSLRRAQARGISLEESDIAASFQEAAVDVLLEKTMTAVRDTGLKVVALAGGVAANSRLRLRVMEACVQEDVACFIPDRSLCGDNGVSIAACAYRRVAQGDYDSLDLGVWPSYRLGA